MAAAALEPTDPRVELLPLLAPEYEGGVEAAAWAAPAAAAATSRMGGGDKPLRNAAPSALAGFFALGLFTAVYLPGILVPEWALEWPRLACSGEHTEEGGDTDHDHASGWCAPNWFDLAFSPALVVAPRALGHASHVLTFVACPFVSLASVLAPMTSPSMPRGHAKEDFAIWSGTQLISAGLNTWAKHSFRRQRPCWHFGKEGETEAAMPANHTSSGCPSTVATRAWRAALCRQRWRWQQRAAGTRAG